jgi:hypothetical protein
MKYSILYKVILILAHAILYIFQCSMKYQPDDDPLVSNRANVEIYKNKVFTYWLIMWKHPVV